MAEKLEDLNLPTATVIKVIKEVLPENVILSKDAKAALSRAASVFILYISSQASSRAHKFNRKTLTGDDVLHALEELDFEHFVGPLENYLKELKDTKQKKKPSPKSTKETAEHNADDENVEEMDSDE